MLKAKGNHLNLWLVVTIFKWRACSVWWRSRPTARTTEKACSCQRCYYYIQMREAELKCKECLSVIPANFSPDTFSWVCNVQVGSLKNKLRILTFRTERPIISSGGAVTGIAIVFLHTLAAITAIHPKTGAVTWTTRLHTRSDFCPLF